ncbi:MAG: hypothetical protein ABIP55_06225, partial [Tepidisphaeraceae bacterium]
NTGFAMLGRALIGPGGTGNSAPPVGAGPYFAGDCVSTMSPGYTEFVAFGPPDATLKYAAPLPVTNANYWAPFGYSDGSNGPGFKVRAGSKSYGPYLAPEKFKFRGVALLDGNDNPILYFPARPGKVAQTPGWVLVKDSIADTGVLAPPVYEAADNLVFFLRPGPPAEVVTSNPDRVKARQRMEALLMTTGTTPPPSYDATMQANEAPITTGPYLLWAAGADGLFGAGKTASSAAPTPADIKDCDDITNFR